MLSSTDDPPRTIMPGPRGDSIARSRGLLQHFRGGPAAALGRLGERMRGDPTAIMRSVNLALGVLSVALALYLLGDVALGRVYRGRPAPVATLAAHAVGMKGAKQAVGREDPGATTDALPPFASYETVLRQRNLFQVAASVGPESGGAQSSRLSQLVAAYSVNAIFLDANPHAIILDRRTDESVNVTVGQFVGQLRVKAIQKGAVLMEYKGEEVTLPF